MHNVIRTIELPTGVTAEVLHDYINPVNPVEDYDFFSTFVCWHSQYDLGHKQAKTPMQGFLDIALAHYSWDHIARCYRQPGESFEDAACVYDWELEDRIQQDPSVLVRKLEKHFVITPLYIYEHSGITISCAPFSCPWDSGQVGFAYVEKSKIRQEFSCKHITKTVLKRANDLIKSEVETYDLYLTGQCYAFAITNQDGEKVDSCFGFLGDIEYCEKEARAAAQPYVNENYTAMARDMESARPDMYVS